MENRNNNALIQTLLDCALACEYCASSCLQEDDVKMMADCIKLDRDCSDICMLAARLLQRDSNIARQYLLLCEEICRACAAECAKHEHEHCKQCAEACQKCAEACHANHGDIQQD
ncbi:four-helix bundle copper-binding protein [Pedobacter endophyticus]|uniref:Four-helix bundle copper-binding protein n=1 Tax=Pedobacter endophyticus TaxID=2789740 RepID=A0A7U3SNU1_9SPHI|nr:four-helix bundle copper-binding protein [Pedobacter endophyticus]QPH37673.1 four-helix bundle copper-binding protein [Pedobacter endophyticus]